MATVQLIYTILLIIGMVCMFANYIRYKKKYENLKYKDELTGHENYCKFIELAIAILKEHTEEKFALLYLDIPRFKYFNDMYGYNEGDIILKNTIEVMEKFRVKNEVVARMYADHFVFFLSYKEKEELTVRLTLLFSEFNKKFIEQGKEYHVIYQGGVYFFHPKEYNVKAAVDAANVAKDTVKQGFSSSFAYYKDSMKEKIKKEKVIEREMKDALSNREFEAYFQPKVDIVTGKIVGAEALVRWNHPINGLIQPGEFIPFFEKSGFVVKLDFFIFEETCRRIRQMMDAGLQPICISSNFSRAHIENKELANQLEKIAKSYQVPTYLLEAELTETLAVDNLEEAVVAAEKLKEKGFRIAIDDFGAGYSSIQLLQKLPLDTLKLDRAYLNTAGRKKIGVQLLEQLILIAHENNIVVVCEGVETKEENDYVAGNHARVVQGYLYGKPMKYQDFLKTIQENQELKK